LIHRLFKNLKRHHTRLQRFVGHDLRIRTKRALRVADIRYASIERGGSLQMAMLVQFFRGNLARREFPVNKASSKVLEIMRGPINKIRRQSIRMNGVVKAPTQFSRERTHATT